MYRSLLAITAIFGAASTALATPSVSFADHGIGERFMNPVAPAPSPMAGLDRLDFDGDNPVTLFSFTTDPNSVIINTLPNPVLVPTNTVDKFTPVLGKGGSDEGLKELPRVVVIPLPAPAGLALAGMLFIAGIRRR